MKDEVIKFLTELHGFKEIGDSKEANGVRTKLFRYGPNIGPAKCTVAVSFLEEENV